MSDFDRGYLTKDEIVELMHEFEASSLAKLSIKKSDMSISMKKVAAYTKEVVYHAPQISAIQSEPQSVPHDDVAQRSMEIKNSSNNFTQIITPIVGTYYEAPSPESKPYVEVGSRVSEGEVVALVEAMKMMNEIKATCSGVVRSILVKNEDVVSFGQALLEIEEA